MHSGIQRVQDLQEIFNDRALHNMYGEGRKFVHSCFYDNSNKTQINTSETTIDAVLVDAEGKKT
jgi:hypothetical protein